MNKNAITKPAKKQAIKTQTGQVARGVGYTPPVDGGYTMPKAERDRLSKAGVKVMRKSGRTKY